MKAYKATYNFKCRNQEYKIGKTYTSDKMKICGCGIHFCKRMEYVLNYYKPNENFKLLEIEVLGDIEFKYDKGVTDKIKVIREIPFEEFSEEMKRQFPVYEYDSYGNKISETYPTGHVYRYEYDSQGNKISMTFPCGDVCGFVYRYEYNSQGNVISETLPDGRVYRYEYDSHDNKILETRPDGLIHRYEYDSHDNKISEIDPFGIVYRYDVAIITESDD